MKRFVPLLAVIAAGLFSAPALAEHRDRDRHRHHHHHHHGHTQFGLYIGAPWYAPVYPPPVYVPPRVIVVPAAPPVYMEQAPAYGANGYWYFCQPANAYYPQVIDCPGDWIRVPARP